ncbi:tripartite tricarboxylate transporter TctB family protein [Falsiroseomonas oryziterrae]|uniref:tripartite tricarboxylate transporter TctB family protein n=1 Tax=Falsiroseomonas oryziterrae TaxID=2911368 RepID=UPI001F344F67|nr:tripartite tricarboxylate transporter TctB family protein [Roseomonas sp. NPKOSM-4]
MDGPGKARKPVGQELIIPALAVGFTLYYFWTVQELAWEAKANGVVIGLLLFGLVAILLVRLGVRVARGEASLRVTLGGDWETDRVRLGLIGLMVAFLVALPFLGTTITLALMLFAGMWLLGGRHWPTLIGVSVITPLFVWATLIVGLGTRFPVGPFEQAMAALLGLGD